jgi:signal transduction histidine kinase/DNA-binding response OmpR family regulator
MTKPLRVLVIEDSEDDAELLLAELRLGGYEPVCERVETAASMKAALDTESWDIIISDYSMPQFSAPAALEVLHETSLDIPFIIVSGAIGEATAVAAMKNGAHDYIMKGSLARLTPAIERELRDAEVRRERRNAEAKVKLQQQRLAALHDINLAITSTLNLSNILEVLLDKIDTLLPYAAVTIGLFNVGTEELEFVVSRNINEAVLKSEQSRKTPGLSAVVFQSKAPLIIDNLQTDSRSHYLDFLRDEQLVSYLGVPMIAKEDTIGVLSFYTKEKQEFTIENVEFLTTLAGQAAIAIHNSQLYEQAKSQTQDLAQANLELEKSNKVKSEFLSVISHELKTPLNVIIGYAGIIKEGVFGAVNSDQEKALDKVLSHSNDLLSMITGILYVTNIEANEIRRESLRFSLCDFLAELKAVFAMRREQHLSLTWDYPVDLPMVETDKDKLNQILQNLIHNAIKFTDSGQVTVFARIRERHAPQIIADQELESGGTEKFVEFRVADTGGGISPEQLPFIFEMFRQADSSQTRRHEGAGLGLYIAKHFTELLGGTINVETELDKGSTFIVSIPCEFCSVNTKQDKPVEFLNQESIHASAFGSNIHDEEL